MLRFYQEFCTALVTIALAALSFALLAQQPISAGGAGLALLIAVSLGYAFVRVVIPAVRRESVRHEHEILTARKHRETGL